MCKFNSILFLLFTIDFSNSRPSDIPIPGVPDPSPKANDCLIEITQSRLADNCPGEYFWINEQKSGNKECCDFIQFHSCLGAKAPIVCKPDEELELREFFKDTMEYLLKFRCPGFKPTVCVRKELVGSNFQNSLEQNFNVLIDEAIEKLKENQGYTECVKSLSSDSFCHNGMEFNAGKSGWKTSAQPMRCQP